MIKPYLTLNSLNIPKNTKNNKLSMNLMQFLSEGIIKSMPELLIILEKRSSADGLAKSISVYGLALSCAHQGVIGTVGAEAEKGSRKSRAERGSETQQGVWSGNSNENGKWE